MGELTHASKAVPESLRAVVSGDVSAAEFAELGLAETLSEHLKGDMIFSAFCLLNNVLQSSIVPVRAVCLPFTRSTVCK